MKAVELRQKQMAAQKAAYGLGINGTHSQAKNPPQVNSAFENKVGEPSSSSGADGSVKMLETATRMDEARVAQSETMDLDREAASIVDASPISLPGVSEGPSTQASSVSEEDPNLVDSVDKLQASPITPSADTEQEGTPKATAQNGDLISKDSGTAGQHEGLAAFPEAEQTVLGTLASAPDKVSAADAPSDTSEPNGTLPNEPKPFENGVAQQLKSGDFWKVTKVLQDNSSSPNAKKEKPEETPKPLDSDDNPSFMPPQDAQLSPVGLLSNFTEAIKPQEVPLPPISEDEEMRLTPLQTTFTSEPVSPSVAQSEPPRQPQAPADITSHPREDDDQSNYARVSTSTRPSTADTAGDRRSIRLNRRHGLVEPIRRVSSGENSDDQFLSDDSFIEELKSATVQEAKPIRVSKSPIAPEFPRPKSENKAELVTSPRSVSSPLDNFHAGDRETLSPQFATLQAPRAVSVSQRRSVSPSETSPPMLKKLGVSSGISQRIKALETLSSRPTSPSQTLHSPANPPPAFGSLNSRKTSFHSRPGTSDRPSRRKTPSPTPTFDISSPKPNNPKPYNQFVSVSMSSKPGKSRPESISVTAKIVRDDRDQPPEVPLDASEPQSLNLHHSPLKVETRTAENMPPPSNKPPIKRHATAPSNSSTSTDHKRESFLSSKRDSFHSNPNGSRRGSDAALSRSASEVSLSGISPDGRSEEKKESRKSRMLKRMSTITSASRRSIATALSPTPTKEREQPIAEQPEPVQQAPPPVVEDMGDVNIQFPDTLVTSSKTSVEKHLTHMYGSFGNVVI